MNDICHGNLGIIDEIIYVYYRDMYTKSTVFCLGRAAVIDRGVFVDAYLT